MATIDEIFINDDQIVGIRFKGGDSPVLPPGLDPPKGMTRILGAVLFDNPKAGYKRVGKCVPCLLQATLRLSCLFQCYMYMYTWAHAHILCAVALEITIYM